MHAGRSLTRSSQNRVGCRVNAAIKLDTQQIEAELEKATLNLGAVAQNVGDVAAGTAGKLCQPAADLQRSKIDADESDPGTSSVLRRTTAFAASLTLLIVMAFFPLVCCWREPSHPLSLVTQAMYRST